MIIEKLVIKLECLSIYTILVLLNKNCNCIEYRQKIKMQGDILFNEL